MVGTFNGLILIDNYDSVEVSGADLDRAIGAEQTSSSTAEFFKKLFLGVCDLTRLNLFGIKIRVLLVLLLDGSLS